MNEIKTRLDALRDNGNLRTIRTDLSGKGLIDLSSNDYLGLAQMPSMVKRFLQNNSGHTTSMTSSASRLLAINQQSYINLEQFLGNLYGRSALLFNSGYHANSGIIPALCTKQTLILCDKLVHASIIDGIILSRAKFVRYRHNDIDQLYNLVKSHREHYSDILIITESIFSMDGDICDLPKLVEIKKECPEVRLYVDEAHGFGVFGARGLGLCEYYNIINDIDIIIGTLGKAGASIGAFAITNAETKEYLINSARSFIFSTMLPPMNCEWSQFMVRQIIDMAKEREHLKNISKQLNDFILSAGYASHSQSQIIPLIVGNAHTAVNISTHLLNMGYIALPIRTPTVPAGTERIRFSLNAGISSTVIMGLINALKTLL